MSGDKNIFHNYNNNDYFIETGSYYGEGIQRALDAGFKNIISIEITPIYYNLCLEKFKEFKNVRLILGDSVKVLPTLLNEIKEPASIWLDAHYTEPSTLYGDKMSPLMDELEIIKAHAQSYNDVILIDDMRIFNEGDWNYANYLFNNDDIKNKLKEIDVNVELLYEDGIIPNDVLVAKFNHIIEKEINNIVKKVNKKVIKKKVK